MSGFATFVPYVVAIVILLLLEMLDTVSYGLRELENED